MSKDPAFLFYSKEFYEGTRTMLPLERACYIDLLIYQHQHGIIPTNIKRLAMYCSGIDEATIEATLEAKFERFENGWKNKALEKRIDERKNYINKQSDNGKIGQFFKKSKQLLGKKDFDSLLNLKLSKAQVIDFLSNYELNIDSLKDLLKRCLSNKSNANAISDSISNSIPIIEKGGLGEKTLKPKKENQESTELVYRTETEIHQDEIWEKWKRYKWDQFKFRFKSESSELVGKNNLIEMANGDPSEMERLVNYAIGNGWKGIHQHPASQQNIKQLDKTDRNKETTLGALKILNEKMGIGNW